MDTKLIIQYSRYKNDPSILCNILPSQKVEAIQYLKRLNEPVLCRSLKTCQHKLSDVKISSQYYLFNKSCPSDPLIDIAVNLLTRQFLEFLEVEHNVVAYHQDKNILIVSFKELDYDNIFWEFLREKYDDKSLKYRWKLVEGLYNLKEYYDPYELKNIILNEKISLELKDTKSQSFSDKSKDICLFCGRSIAHNFEKYKEAMGGFVEFAAQRPQGATRNENAYICPICLFSSCISLVRTSNPMGLKYGKNAVFTIEKENKPYEAVFNRLLGISVGSYLAIKNIDRQTETYGKTATAYILASIIPTEVILKCDIKSNFSTENLDKRKILAIKAFEEVLGRNKMYSSANNDAYRKAHYEILKCNYYNLFQHLGILLNNNWRKDKIIDDGIYKMIKWDVIQMDEAKLVFGTALLIDSFMPKSWSGKEADKTEARKVAYYLDEPEEVLYRLRGFGDETRSVAKHFSNAASYKLLKDMLREIYEKEEYGNFNEKIKINDGQEFMLLSLDDVLKAYFHIRDYFWNVYKNEDERTMRKRYSDFMSKVKYALVARRPELLGGE